MGTLPRTTDMDLAKQGQMASLQGSESMTGMRSSAAQRSYKTTPMPWGLMEFYGGEQPWVPAGIIPESQQGRQVNPSGIQRRVNASSFNGWRSNLPSECDTVPPGFPPSDSGYESRTKQSIENTSVFDDVDQSQDSQSLAGHMMEYQPFEMSHGEPHWILAATPVPVAQNGAVDNKLVCPDCRAPCKTKSELNKHNQRHRKAFKCDVSGCSRKEGFGTQNDLDRHRSSVHRDVFKGGPQYRCHIGPCQTKDKIWPRADNFRQHLKRVHDRTMLPEDDLSDFVLQPPAQKTQERHLRQNANDDLEGVGSELFASFNPGPIMTWDGQSSALGDVQLSPPEQSIPMELVLDPSLTRVEVSTSNASHNPSAMDTVVSNTRAQDQNSHQVVNDYADSAYVPPQSRHEFVQPGEISKTTSEKTVAVGRPDLRSDGVRGVQSQHSAAAVSPYCYASSSVPSQEEVYEKSSTERTDIDDISKKPVAHFSDDSSTEDQSVDKETIKEALPKIRASSTSLNEELDEQAMLNVLSKMPKSLIEDFLKGQADSFVQKTTSTLSSNVDSQHRCTHYSCHKDFKRKCELKKHMKRHNKPYGCTFFGCKKKFGSKNDWKRHENSQHFQLEVWKCLEQRAEDNNDNCGKVCHRRETFRSHLQKEHKMGNAVQIENSLDKCRVGRTGESRFWCGFCVKIIEVTEDTNAWTERFNHIDNHYAGRDNLRPKDISEWIHVDPDLTETVFTGSPDDSSDADSCDDDYVAVDSSKTPIVDKTIDTDTKKRSSREDDEDGQWNAKRLKGNQTYMWTCCSCKWDADIKLHAACINCPHVRCNDCGGNWVTALDDKDASRASKAQT